MRAWICLSSLLVIGCAPEEACKDTNCLTDVTDESDTLTTDEPVDTAPPELPACDEGIEETFPEAGTNDAYFRTRVEILLDEADESATLSLTTPNGRRVAGTSAIEGARVVFTPDENLDPDKEYTATLRRDCGEWSFAFETAPVSGLVSPDILPGRTYEIDIFGGRIVRPAGVGALLPLIAGDTLPILAGVAAADASTLDWRIGAGTTELPMTQELCAVTAEIAAADFSANPYFEFEAAELNIDLTVAVLPITNARLSGSFAPAAISMQGIAISGVIDARDFSGLLIFDADELCSLLGGCVACPDGEETCLPFYADSITGPLVPGLEMVQVTPADAQTCFF